MALLRELFGRFQSGDVFVADRAYCSYWLVAALRARGVDVAIRTTSLFSALDVATGQVVGRCYRRHRHQEFVAFLDHINATRVREPGTTIHVVMDNYGTHKHPVVKPWFARHPEYVPHFTPTSSSWLNQVERFFAQITERRIRRGAFKSVEELEKAIEDYLAAHNTNPKPFV